MKVKIFLSLLGCIITISVCCQVNIDTTGYIQTEKRNNIYDTIIKNRIVLFDEMQTQNPKVKKIALLQSKLNNISDSAVGDVLLSVEENLMLFIYQHEWDSVLSVISYLRYPYKVNMLSIGVDFVYVSKQGGNGFVPLNKSLFVNNNIFTSISNSSLLEEQKCFLKLFIHSYFGYKYIQGNIKIKSAYREFEKKYPDSRYSKYILIDNNIYRHRNWPNEDKK
jgi:hypothetical protein